MFIKQFKAGVDGEYKNNIEYYLDKDLLCKLNARTHSKPEGEWLNPGEEIVLLSSSGSMEDRAFLSANNSVRNRLKTLSVLVKFQDIYDIAYPESEVSQFLSRKHIRKC